MAASGAAGSVYDDEVGGGRRVPAERSVGRGGRFVAPLLLATVPYLIFEMAFSARLLDMSSGLPTADEAHAVEVVGRLVSGVALGLAAVGMIIRPQAERREWSGGRTAVAAALATALCVAATWTLEPRLIDAAAESSSAQTRRAALTLNVVSEAARRGNVGVEGVYLTPEQRSAPEGKAFGAIFGGLALSTPDVEQAARPHVESAAYAIVAGRLGAPERLFDEVWTPGVRTVERLFAAYREADAAHAKAVATADVVAERAWSDFTQRLRAGGYRPDSLPSSLWSEARGYVRGRGAPVSDDWRPFDKPAFVTAARADAVAPADRAFADAMRRLVDDDLPTTMIWSAFYAHPAVQKKWASALADVGLKTVGRLRPDADVAEFRARVYEPSVRDAAAREVARLAEPVEAFADGGRNADIGVSAVRSLLVPPVALALSMLGALTHVGKIAAYATTMATAMGVPGSRIPRIAPALVGAATFIGLGVYADTRPVGMVDTSVWRSIETAAAADPSIGPPAARGARWLVKAEALAYPVGEALRRGPLFGATFGYEGSARPTTGTAASPTPRR